MGLEELVRSMQDAGGEDDEPTILPEAQIEILRAAYERYRKGCPFKPGELVTPIKNYNIKGAGRPHIVLEVADPPIRTFDYDDLHSTSSRGYGRCLDIRVMSLCSGEYLAHWVESYAFEPYAEPPA